MVKVVTEVQGGLKMNRCFLFFLFYLPSFADQGANTDYPVQSSVKFMLADLGLQDSVDFLPQSRSSLLLAKPVLDQNGQDALLNKLSNEEDEWKEDTMRHCRKNGVSASFRQRKTGIGSLHVNIRATTEQPGYMYELHVDWHYSGWDHPVSSVKHILGECWFHRWFKTKTNQDRLLQALKRKNILQNRLETSALRHH
jgi:hypothetical protein